MSIQAQKADAVGAIMAHFSHVGTAYTPASETYKRTRDSLMKKFSLEELDKMYCMCLSRAKVRHPVFVATAKDISHNRSPMHLQSDSPNVFTKYFYSIHKAKKFCEKHHGLFRNWLNPRKDYYHSKDLGHVMYEIKKLEVTT